MTVVDTPQNVAGRAAEALIVACSLPFGADWNHREEMAYDSLCRCSNFPTNSTISRPDVFLGGDLLRPYLTLRLDDQLCVVSKQHARVLSKPKLIKEIDFGELGRLTKTTWQSQRTMGMCRRVPDSVAVSKRLAVPKLYLTSLTNVSRYQTRRYPLNVSRLAQWVRFQHAGRVRVTDLALNFKGDHGTLFDDLIAYDPDVIGVSLNFGELEAFRNLMSTIAAAKQDPVICVGNVLAAWAPDEVREICQGFEVHISQSYGEVDLEEVCRSFANGSEGGDGSKQSVSDVRTGASNWPEILVLPDDHLLASTLKQGGQASIETSFGCQYSRCSFCSRDHRGRTWWRPRTEEVDAVIDEMTSQIGSHGKRTNILSFVDEDAFGEEGITRGLLRPSIVDLISTAGENGTGCEIYTRLEQVFDRRRSPKESIGRIHQLSEMRPNLVRVFVGVESGSDSQLRRYAKGQTTAQVVDALRTGSLIGLPLEFGFITFDPLLTQEELAENAEFLARRDVLPELEGVASADEIYHTVIAREDEGTLRGDPLFTRVAYMATELELFANSPFVKRLRHTHPQLIGEYQSSFSRYDYEYQDPVIGSIAAWCRVWTENTFRPVYRLRLASRTLRGASNVACVHRYREATFHLLLNLGARFADRHIATRFFQLFGVLASDSALELDDKEFGQRQLQQLWSWVTSAADSPSSIEDVDFNLDSLTRRREI